MSGFARALKKELNEAGTKKEKRKYKCNGCGEDRPCMIESNQEPTNHSDLVLEQLKCVLDETNQTSFNWCEV